MATESAEMSYTYDDEEEDDSDYAFEAESDCDYDYDYDAYSESDCECGCELCVEEREDACDCSTCQDDELRLRSVTRKTDSASLEGGSGGEHQDTEDHQSDKDKPFCAVCFGNDALTTLPCCGLEGCEERSSTRFCRPCLQRILELVLPGLLVGPCPRCRQLISWDIDDIVNIQKATFRAKMLYVEDRNESGYRAVLLSMAFGNPRFLPMEMLRCDHEIVHQMVRWNMLKSNKCNNVFSVDPKNQLILREHFELKFRFFGEEIVGGEGVFVCPGWKIVALHMLNASWKTFCDLRLLTSVRLLHESSIAFLRATGIFPLDQLSWCKTLLVTALHAFVATLAGVALSCNVFCLLATYVAVEFCSLILGNQKTAIRRGFFMLTLAMLASGVVIAFLVKWLFWDDMSSERPAGLLLHNNGQQEILMEL